MKLGWRVPLNGKDHINIMTYNAELTLTIRSGELAFGRMLVDRSSSILLCISLARSAASAVIEKNIIIIKAYNKQLTWFV